MQTYIGTKIINAKPMNRLDYNQFRGWKLPADENGTDEGYLVEYVDGGQANTEEYSGYVSWSPKDVFEKAYKASGNLSFGAAIEMLKLGKKVARNGWNGKGMFLVYVPKTDMVNTPFGFKEGSIYDKANVGKCDIDAHIDMYTAQGTFQPGWLASQADMLATDWTILEN